MLPKGWTSVLALGVFWSLIKSDGEWGWGVLGLTPDVAEDPETEEMKFQKVSVGIEIRFQTFSVCAPQHPPPPNPRPPSPGPPQCNILLLRRGGGGEPDPASSPLKGRGGTPRADRSGADE